MSLEKELAKFGVAPIECGYDNPNCLGGYTGILNASDAWGSVHNSWLYPVAPNMQTINLGNNPIDNPPLSQDDTGGVKCPRGTSLVNGECIDIATGLPLGTLPNDIILPVKTASVNPVNAINLQTTLDSVVTKIKANPVLALGAAGFLIYLIAKK